jgi:hypothetical protein
MFNTGARLRKTDSIFVNELQNHDRQGVARNLEFCAGIELETQAASQHTR